MNLGVSMHGYGLGLLELKYGFILQEHLTSMVVIHEFENGET